MKLNTLPRLGIYGLLAGSLWLGTGASMTIGAAADQHMARDGGGHGMTSSHGGHSGKRGGTNGGHGGGDGGLFGSGWKSTLTPDQQARLDGLKVAQMKVMMPMMARAKAIRMDLVTMALADDPDQRTLSSKVDEMLALKRQMMMSRFRHIIEQREVLTPEQRGSFDVMMMKKLAKKGGGHGGH